MAEPQDAYAMLGQGPFIGQVKKMGAKFGFISCDVTHRHLGQDIFVVNNQSVPAGLASGVRVLFHLVRSDKGEPQATRIELFGGGNQQPQQQAAPQNFGVPIYNSGFARPGSNVQQLRPSNGFIPQPQVQRPVTLVPSNQTQNSTQKTVHVEIYSGLIKSISEKGFAFVNCPKIHKMYGRDCYLGSEELEFGLEIGAEVHFILKLNEKRQPIGKLVPPHGKFSGTLKAYDAHKGFGFIDCAEARRVFDDADVFIHRNEVEPFNLQVDDRIEFCVVVNQKGQPQANRMQTYVGSVKKSGTLTFIENAELKAKYGRDVFVFNGSEFEQGQVVRFMCVLNAKGEPKAIDTSLTDEPLPPQGEFQDGPPTFQKGTEYKRANLVPQEGTFEGTVKSLGNKYGFVESAHATQMFGQDVFIRPTIRDAANLQIGDAITFQVSLNEKNQPQAAQVHKRGFGETFEDNNIATNVRMPDQVNKKQRVM